MVWGYDGDTFGGEVDDVGDSVQKAVCVCSIVCVYVCVCVYGALMS